MSEANTAQQINTTVEALPVGTMLSGDQFTITGQLGAGGFGITYRAVDNVLGRPIVIKECFADDFCYREGKDVVARNPAQGDQFRSIVTMFMHEVRSLAKLRHPNIVAVHRAFEENQTAYMVLDLIDGLDMFDILETNKAMLPPARVKDILLQLLDAIEKVHDLDLLHRDISPDNIILEKSGTPVLIDFGAARGDASRRTRAISALLVIKDGYSPQEFYTPGSRQTQSSDLYALGATFYHAVSGISPANSQARMVEVAARRPDPCEPLAGRFPEYDPAFLEAIDKAMRVLPEERLQSVAEWRNLISKSEEQDALPGARSTPKPVDLDLGLTLTRLVQSTNDEVKKTRLLEVEQPKQMPSDPPAAKPDRPEWVDEFNQDSLEPEQRRSRARDTFEEDFDEFDDFDDEDEFEVEAPIRSARPRSQDIYKAPDGKKLDTDWVNRALEKQQRAREERQEQDGALSEEMLARKRASSLAVFPTLAPAETPEETQKPASMIGTMLKVLLAGITVGLIVILVLGYIFPGLIPGV